MADLVVTSLPNRKGTFLAFQEGGSIRVFARFSYDGADQEFIAWAVAAGIQHTQPEGGRDGTSAG